MRLVRNRWATGNHVIIVSFRRRLPDVWNSVRDIFYRESNGLGSLNYYLEDSHWEELI